MSFETIAVNFTHSNCEEIQIEALSSHSERIELRRRSEVSPKEVGTGIALGKAKRRPSAASTEIRARMIGDDSDTEV